LSQELWPNNILLFQVAEWGADGVIVGSAMVKLLGEAATPKEGLVSLEKFARELKAVLPKWWVLANILPADSFNGCSFYFSITQQRYTNNDSEHIFCIHL
jgi:hypothetical protein